MSLSAQGTMDAATAAEKDDKGGTFYITQRAQVSGQKVQKAVKLPRIDSAKGVDVVTQSSQSTELLQANKQMAEVQGQLEQKKVEFNERMAKVKEKEESLNMKQAKLTAEANRFQLFVKENEAKRQRALKRAQDEVNIRKQKEKEAEELRKDVEATEAKLEQSKRNLEAGLVYQNYLEKVVEHSEDFAEIGDILKRYQTLVATNGDLQAMVRQNIADSEQSRLQLHQLSKQLQNEVLVQSSVIAEHQERLEKAKIETVIEEQQKETREDESKDAIRVLGEARLATFNLYNRCRSTHMAESRPKQEAKEVLTALRYIEERFKDLEAIVRQAQAEGLIGEHKIREAVVDRQMVATTRAAAGGEGAGGKAAAKSKTASGKITETAKGASQNVGGSGSGSNLVQPPIQ